MEIKADVAQLVEQSIRNRQVIGSSPIVGSTNSFRSINCPPSPVGIVFECGGVVWGLSHYPPVWADQSHPESLSTRRAGTSALFASPHVKLLRPLLRLRRFLLLLIMFLLRGLRRFGLAARDVLLRWHWHLRLVVRLGRINMLWGADFWI